MYWWQSHIIRLSMRKIEVLLKSNSDKILCLKERRVQMKTKPPSSLQNCSSIMMALFCFRHWRCFHLSTTNLAFRQEGSSFELTSPAIWRKIFLNCLSSSLSLSESLSAGCQVNKKRLKWKSQVGAYREEKKEKATWFFYTIQGKGR